MALNIRWLPVGIMALALLACRAPDEQAAAPHQKMADPSAPSARQPTVDPPVRELPPDTEVERRLSPDEWHAYNLALVRGDFLEIAVEQQGVDVVLSLFDPQRDRLLEMDLPIEDLGPERLLAVAEQTGSYRLEVRPWSSDTSDGGYRIRLQIRRPAGEVDLLRARAARIFDVGEGLASSRELDAAIERYDEALEVWRQAGDRFWQGETLDRKGDALARLHLWRESAEVHEQAAKLFHSLGEARFEAISLNDLAAARFELGDLESAFRHHSRALELRRQVEDPRGMAIARDGLGTIYKIWGETQTALDHFSQALEGFDRPQDRRYRARVLHNLGTLYGQTGKPEEAMECLQAAVQIFADLDEPWPQASSLSQIGRLDLEMGEYEHALRVLSRAQELYAQVEDRRGQAVVLRRIGSVHQALGDAQDAWRQYQLALDLLHGVESPRTKAAVLQRFGALADQLGRNEEALDFYREALSLNERVSDPMVEAESLLGMASALRQRGDLQAARRAGERALTIAESLRVKPLSEDLRFSYFSTAQRFFDFYIELLMDLHSEDPKAGYAAQAFQVSERARARSLLDLLVESGAEIRSDAAPELLEEERALQRRLNATLELVEDPPAVGGNKRAEVRRILGRLDSVRSEIRRRSPRYAALTQPQPLSLARIQREVMDRETILLEYKLARERSFLWLVESDAFTSIDIAAGEDIDRSVRQLHQLLSQGPPRRESELRTATLLCGLSRRLLEPVADRLGRKRLAIVAEGALQYLPFAALPDPGSSPDCSEASPLMVAHEIVYLPSASTLAVLRREDEAHRAPAGLVAVLADPVYSAADPRVAAAVGPKSSHPMASKHYPRLEHSRAEAARILDLVPADRGYLALDFDASKATVLSGALADFEVVHFATHGILDTRQPELSGVVLSLFDRDGQPVDGFLRSHEIYNLRMPADLVVLGACETALGKEVKGEGLVGLTRGFMHAGASRVMVSLWRVDDRATSELMATFYRALLERQLDPTAALREAQLTVREERPQPSYWAGFVLQGEWRRGY